ncbi:CCN family member 3-like [Dreissena polymorpha]|uniref:VWFC domain-containing protein n=1 Tax=Dreissena polymorpha TaxID=45954 RepID=A0A9D4LRG8_DREPO|nr:CCN family member 3-like [Dreissena polymorpha]KAH3863348.1 hypothetical protein DPMN_026333 [Dreissena polymorpha]
MFTLLNINTVFGLATIASLVLSLPQTPTPPTTAAQRIPIGACVVDGKIYQNGETIHQDKENCFYSSCLHGYVVQGDNVCFFGQPDCPNGHLVDIPGQCCHECIKDITTVPPSAIVG